jgi:hypothetical protein
MTTIFERVYAVLTTLSPAIAFALKPYETTAALPDTFIEYELISSPPEQHADGGETERSYTIQISIWDVTGLVTLPDVDTAFIAAGFQKGAMRQLPKDQQTGHFGIVKDYIYF